MTLERDSNDIARRDWPERRNELITLTDSWGGRTLTNRSQNFPVTYVDVDFSHFQVPPWPIEQKHAFLPVFCGTSW
jgi:hypothetical protein